MKPEDVNKMNSKKHETKKMYKYCEKCQNDFFVPGYKSKCPVCKGVLSFSQMNNSSNIPKCPTCGSTDLKKISTTSKVAGAAMFGLFSKTARSQFECKNCGYKW